MNNNPLVSIIVRTKDRPKLLLRALKSIAAQTYRPIEVVLVNDGGCDLDIEEIHQTLGDISVNYIRLEQNTGRAHAGNVGIDNAKGEYIGFLDDDDEFYPEHVETLANFLKCFDYKAAYTDVEMVFGGSALDNSLSSHKETKVFSKDFSYSDILIINYIPFNSLMFCREIIDSGVRLDESLELYEDWDFLIRIGQEYPFWHIKNITARYNQWDSDLQINRRSEEQMKIMHLKIMAKHRERITNDFILEIFNERNGLRLENIEMGGIINRVKTILVEFMSHDFLKPEIENDKDFLLTKIHDILHDKEDLIHRNQVEITKLQRKVNEMQKVIYEKEVHISMMENNLMHMRDTIGWRLLEKIRLFRDRALPSNTFRRKMYDIFVKSMKIIIKEGFHSFYSRVSVRLKSYIETYSYLFKKALLILKKYGVKTFVQYSYQYLINGKGLLRKTNIYNYDAYEQWILRNEKYEKLNIIKEIKGFGYKPKISVITPVYNIDARWLNKCIESVMKQFYENWELCIHDDGSRDKDTLKCLRDWKGKDNRIKISFGDKNRGISNASNAALKLATGEFIALLDCDDELSPDALYENVKIINLYPDTDMIYSDEDKIEGSTGGITGRFDPFFKPDWSPQLLFSFMYIGHLTVYRKKLVDELGGFRAKYDFSQDYDLALRAVEKTERIKHIPKILYHWRSIPGSAASGSKEYARKSNIDALKSAVSRRGYDAEVLEYSFANRVKFNMRKYPMVSIIIPTDMKDNIFNCIELLLKNTLYLNFEIIVVTNSELGENILGCFKDDPRIKIHRFDKPFNFSLKCNEGAAISNGEFLLFLNDDVEAIDGTWLEDMVCVFGRGNVGGVSPKLFYENDTIQYAGMVTGVRGLVGTAFHCQPKDSGFYFNLIQSERNVRLLSGACMLMPKKLFQEIGGFDAVNAPIMHSDIDLCFRIMEKGYDLIYTPFAALRHIGHLSLRSFEKSPAKSKKETHDIYVLKKWGDYLGDDPFYTHNMKECLYEGGGYYYRMFAGRQNESFFASKNILLITHDLSLSGAPILMHNLACRFKDRGYFVVAMSPCEGDLLESYRNENIPLIIDSTISENPAEVTIRFMANFDLIMINTLVMWRIVLLAKEIDVPALWFIHESQFGVSMVYADKNKQEALAEADDVVFIGEKSAGLYQKYNKSDNFKTVNYAAKPLSSDGHFADKDNEKLNILHIGSIEHRKGQDIIIRSINKLHGRYIDGIEVNMIGRRLNNPMASKYYDDIVQSAAKLKNIYFLGEVPYEEVSCYMNEADIFVCTSRDEVGPLTVLEAMSAGKAIISADVGGVSYMIRNGEDGLIVPPDDAGALAKAIAFLYDNRNEIKRFGVNARKRFYDNFTIEKQADGLLNIIESRLKDRSMLQEANNVY
jgi:glycosyltransferase involved in cell wall biosynthesis